MIEALFWAMQLFRNNKLKRALSTDDCQCNIDFLLRILRPGTTIIGGQPIFPNKFNIGFSSIDNELIRWPCGSNWKSISGVISIVDFHVFACALANISGLRAVLIEKPYDFRSDLVGYKFFEVQ
jgi:hypothetical protein